MLRLKICPKCGKKCAARETTCSCGYVFSEKDPVYFLWKMVHEQVITDRLRESRILLNLLCDIAKFKEQGRRTPTDTL